MTHQRSRADRAGAARVIELSPKYWRETSEQPRIQRWLATNTLRKVSLATSHSEEATPG